MRKVKRETNTGYLKELSVRIKSRQDSIRAVALKLAEEKGWELRKTYPDGSIIELMGVTESGQPLYYETNNLNAARTTSTDRIQPGGDLGLNLSGENMIIGEWDGGDVRTSHVEFNNTGFSRVIDMDGPSDLSNHATHVAGTLIGGGVDPDARGMAFNAELHAYDWFDDFSETADAAADGLLISNHSYGYITGWRYDSNLEVWEWFGDPFISEEEDYRFGFYTFTAFLLDDIAYNAPYYLYVKSAGNDRGDWDGSSTIHPPDGGVEGYDCIGQNGNAKNILTVGAIHDLPNGYSNAAEVEDASFSSMGPTDDGRIKPDIVGNGVGLWSPLAGSDTDYESYSGTSMSAPNVSGSLALLQELYEANFGEYMRSATLKALAIATADEAGPDPGPDYKFGWGVLNAATAANTILENNASTRIQEEEYLGSAQTFTITASDSEPLVATIVWTDPAGTVPEPALDPTDQILVNDLDLSISSSSGTFFPYNLSLSDPSAPATTGVNHVDNVEKVVIENPVPGEEYTIEISHTGFIQGLTQEYSLIVTGVSTFLPNDLRVANVYGLTTTGQSEILNSPLYIEVINSGIDGVQDVQLEMNALGANEFSTSRMISNLDSGDTTLVVIPDYQSLNTGNNQISFSLPDDDNILNNEGIFDQEATEGTYSYLTDDPPSGTTLGFGTGEGALLTKYHVSGTRNLTEVKVYLQQGEFQTIRPVVMDTLGNILASGEEYEIEFDDLDTWLSLPLTNAGEVSNQIVYAGIELYQSGVEWFPLGLQEEVPGHPDAYYSAPIGGGEPVFGPYRDFGRWMIELETCKLLPEGYFIQGPQTLCEGETVEYTIGSSGDATYEWDAPSGWNAEINGNTLEVTPSESGTISITPFNDCSEGEAETLSITVLENGESSESVNLCQGESYIFPDGTSEENILSDMTYVSQLQGENGCDSLVTTSIEIYEVEDGSEEVFVCEGGSVVFPDGSGQENIDEPFSYTSLLENVNGCDSLVVTAVSIYEIEQGFETVSVCQGGSITFPDGSSASDIQSDFTYTSVLTSSTGCDSLVLSEVQVDQINNEIVQNDADLIGPSEMESYQWLDCNSDLAPIEGETSQVFTPLESGSYALIVENQFGCTDTSACFEILNVSTLNRSGTSKVVVFPNPSQGEITVNGIQALRYELYDIDGKLVEDAAVNSESDSFRITFEERSAGIYMLRLISEEGYEEVRLLLE